MARDRRIDLALVRHGPHSGNPRQIVDSTVTPSIERERVSVVHVGEIEHAVAAAAL